MGRLEKIVVVTVLFLVAVILGVSLNSGPEDDPSKGPLATREGARNGGARARRNTAQEGALQEQPAASAAQPLQQPTPEPASTQPGGLLSSSVASPNGATAPAEQKVPATQVPPQPAPAALQPAPARFLVTRDGLEPTASEDWMLYTWKQGDTFKDLAQRFYGSQLHVARLRAANEGRDETKLAAGERILVAAKSATALASDATAPATKPGEKSAWAGGLYEVKSGDVLGTISQQVYGTSKKWKKIYDANRDVIGDNPNTLAVGTKLRIPE